MTESRMEAFVARLKKLDSNGDRGALAHLRRGLGRAPGEAVEMLPLVAPFLPKESYDDWIYFTVAALFASHPCQSGLAMGRAYARLITATDSDSVERRFMQLLDSDAEDLPGKLRHAVSLLKAHDIPLDYSQLLYDLLHWTHENRFIQRIWAMDFWGGVDKYSGADAQTKSDDNNENNSELENE